MNTTLRVVEEEESLLACINLQPFSNNFLINKCARKKGMEQVRKVTSYVYFMYVWSGRQKTDYDQTGHVSLSRERY